MSGKGALQAHTSNDGPTRGGDTGNEWQQVPAARPCAWAKSNGYDAASDAAELFVGGDLLSEGYYDAETGTVRVLVAYLLDLEWMVRGGGLLSTFRACPR